MWFQYASFDWSHIGCDSRHIRGGGGRSVVWSPALAASNPLNSFIGEIVCLWKAEALWIEGTVFPENKNYEKRLVCLWVRNFIWILTKSLMEICQSKLPSMNIQHPYRHKQSLVYLFLAFPIFFIYTQHVTHPHFPLWHTGKPLVFYCRHCSVAPSSAFWNNLASTDPSSPTVRPFLRWDCGEVPLEDDYGAALLSDTLLWKHAARELL